MRLISSYFVAFLLLVSVAVVGQTLGDGPTRLLPVTLDKTMITGSGLSGYVNSAVVDGDTSTCGWQTDAAGPGSYLQAELWFASTVVQANVFAATAGATARYRVQYSDDGTAWLNASGSFVPSALGWNTKTWSNVGPHRHWRLLLENTPGPGPWFCELQLYADLAPIALNSSMFTQSGLSGFMPDGIADGDVSTQGWHTDSAVAGATLNVDLGAIRSIRQTNVYASSTPPFPAWSWPIYHLEFSEDAVTWTYAWYGPEIQKAGWNGQNSTNLSWFSWGGAHRYWRFYLENTPGPGPWATELEILSDRSTYRQEPISASQLSQNGLAAYFPNGITDGNLTTYGWHTDLVPPGAWLQVDLGTPRPVVQAGVYATNYTSSYSGPSYVIDYSDDAAQWTQVSANIPGDVSISVHAQGWNFVAWPNAGAHRYWRLRVIGGILGPWLSELKLLSVDTREMEGITPSMLSQTGLTAFNADAIVDGDNTNNGWHTDSATAGAALQVDLGTAKPVVQANIYAAAPYSSASYTVQYSDDTITWNSAKTGFVPAAHGRNSIEWASVGAHRYWRLLLENTPGLGAWLTELELLSAR